MSLQQCGSRLYSAVTGDFFGMVILFGSGACRDINLGQCLFFHDVLTDNFKSPTADLTVVWSWSAHILYAAVWTGHITKAHPLQSFSHLVCSYKQLLLTWR